MSDVQITGILPLSACWEPSAGRLRRMSVMARVPVSFLALAAAMLSACSGVSSSGGGDCESDYDPVATAPSWAELKEAMLRYEGRGPVVSVRVQARGMDVGVGVGNESAVRVVDLLNKKGRRVVQVDVWRTKAAGWSAGVWNQCID